MYFAGMMPLVLEQQSLQLMAWIVSGDSLCQKEFQTKLPSLSQTREDEAKFLILGLGRTLHPPHNLQIYDRIILEQSDS